MSSLDKIFASSGAQTLRAAVGRRITGLARDQYLFNGEPEDTDAGSLEVRFGDGSLVTLALASDGESVRAHAKPIEIPEPFAVGPDSHCSFERIDLLVDPRFSGLTDAVLAGAEAVIDRWKRPPHHEVLIGWVLRLSTGDHLTYVNNGDDSRVLINEDAPDFDEADTRLEPLPE